MSKAIFITKVHPTYDDIPETRYQFPRIYLTRAREAVGDQILYYEPRKGGGRGVYFAVAKVDRIDEDVTNPGLYYARIADYIEFPDPVPFRIGEHYFESALRLPDGRPNAGTFQQAVHPIPEEEFSVIVHYGMQPSLDLMARGKGAVEAIAEPPADYGRKTVESLVRRPVRDAAFAQVVKEAYQQTCAMTGLKLVNGGGKSEVEAAHIRPVERAGPDSPRNGVALSQTVHWMFDRGLLSIEDNGKILVARKHVPERVRTMLNADGHTSRPDKQVWRPHPQFLRYHRENVYVG